MGASIIARGAGLCILALLAGGCAVSKNMDAAKTVRAKNPHASVEYLARVLEVEPQNPEAIALLDEIGKEIAGLSDAKIRDYVEAKKFAQAVGEADKVIATRDFIAKGPSKVDLFVDEERRPKLAQSAAEQFYVLADQVASGEGAMSPASAKKAAISFRRALGFVPGFRDAQQRYETCRELGMTRVAFGRFDCKGGADFLADRFKGELKSVVGELNPEFLSISGNRDPKTNALLTADIEGGFRDTGWQSKPQKNTITKSREIGIDDKGNTLYEQYDVTATWVVHTRKTQATLTLRYQVKDLQGSQLDAGNGSMKMHDEKTYVDNFGGDTGFEDYEEAIPYSVQELPKQRVEPANQRTLYTSMSEQWARKGNPIYEFGHKIYTKFSGQRGN